MFNNIFYNPGATGVDTVTNISLLYRNQWTGYSPQNVESEGGAPVTQILSGSTKLRKWSSGIGGFVMHETLGPIRNVNAKLSYAYHVQLTRGTLSFGVKAGVFSQRVDASVWNPVDPNDPTLTSFNNQRQSDLQPDVGAGIWYQSKGLYAGISGNHINSPDFFTDYSDSTSSELKNHGYLTAGYRFHVNTTTEIVPSILYKTDYNSFEASSFDVSALARFYNGKYWGGLSFRQEDAVSMIIGMGLLEQQSLRIGYGVDLTVMGNNVKQGTSHEVMLSYVIPVKAPEPEPVIHTPRFRYE